MTFDDYCITRRLSDMDVCELATIYQGVGVFFFTLLLIDKCTCRLAQAVHYLFEYFDALRDIVRKIRIVSIRQMRARCTIIDHRHRSIRLRN